jgi:orotidine-5'-phosphate decarboxylase
LTTICGRHSIASKENMTMTFLNLLLAASRRNRSLLCVGLDPDPARIPAALRVAPDPVYAFCAAIVEATADLVCAFKPNIAFFEALGTAGHATLRRVIDAVPGGVPVILDAKRGDMDSTAAAYAKSVFEVLGAGAVTLNPYLGSDALAPFLRYADRGCLLLCKTSNPGSADLQDLPLAGGGPLYLEVARRAQIDWNTNGNVGLVVGATHPDQLRAVRELCPELPLLVPGVGAQGGDPALAVRAAVDRHGERAIISASRSILYASQGDDFAEAARREALRLREEIRVALA